MRVKETTIWELILRPHFGAMTPDAAKAILEMSIPENERVHMKDCFRRPRQGN